MDLPFANAFAKNIPRRLWLLLLLAVACLVWSPYIGNGFLESWDDPVQVLHPDVAEINRTNLGSIFSSLYLGMYQPLTSSLYAVVNTFFHQSAPAFHFVSIVLHLLNTAFVFLFLRRLPLNGVWRWIITALFALHPVQQEAVGWASATSTLLFSLCFILSLLLYIAYIQDNRRTSYVLSLLLFLLACLAKPSAITLPFVLFLLDYLFARRIDWPAVREKLPFLLFAFVFGLVVLVERGGYMTPEALGIDYHLGWLFPYSFFAVLQGYFWPPSLSGIYEYPLELPVAGIVVSSVLLLFLLFLVLRYRNSNRLFVFGVGFYFINLLLVSNVFGYSVSFIDLRRLYLPALGPLLAVSSLNFLKNPPPRLAFFCAAPLIGLLAFISHGDSIHWKNAHSFYEWNIRGAPPHGISLSNLGIDYSKDPAMTDALFEVTQKLRAQYSKGERYKNVLMLEPLGYLYRGEVQKAVDIVQELIEKYPDDREAALFSARTYHSLTLYDRAVAPAKRAAALYDMASPERYEMLVMLYTIFREQDDNESVIWVLDQVIATLLSGELHEDERANLHRFYSSKSLRLEELDRFDEAATALRQALEAAERYGAPPDKPPEYRRRLQAIESP